MIKKENILLKHTDYIYYGNVMLLIFVLFFGNVVNNSRGWINILGLSFQPSEFMKIALILKLSSVLKNDKNKNDNIKLLKVVSLTLIPSVFVFLEPDTGNVVCYLFILFVMCFVAGIKLRYFIFVFILLLITIFGISYFYLFNPSLINEMFSSLAFYRIHRILDWKSSSGLQLTSSLISIGSAFWIGNGFNNPSTYIPEAYTDFIFPVFVSSTGVIGGVMLILLYLILFMIFYTIFKESRYQSKIVISGAIAVFMFSIFENIGMTLGLFPITGIPLPFISYGGSNLIVSFILIYLILNNYYRKGSTLKYINNPK